MIDNLKKSYNEVVNLLTDNKSYLFITFLLCLFASWNGIHFIIHPSHFFLFSSSDTLSLITYDLNNSFKSFLPFSIFLLLSVCFIFCFLKNLTDIFLINIFKKKMSAKESFALFFNFSIPNLLFIVSLFFLSFTLLLFFVLLYLLLLAVGINISLNFLLSLLTIAKSFFLLIFMISLVVSDITLYFQYNDNSFINSVKKTILLIKKDFVSFLNYFFLKILFISFSLIIFTLIVKLMVLLVNNNLFINSLYQKFYLLNPMTNWQDYLLNHLKLFISFSLSVFFFAVSSFPFMLLSKSLTWNILDFDAFKSYQPVNINTTESIPVSNNNSNNVENETLDINEIPDNHGDEQ